MIDVTRFPLVSEQVDYSELRVIIRELCGVLSNKTPGDLVELGCYNGTTSLFIERELSEHEPKRNFHVYDSFEGLPPKTGADDSPAGTQFVAGELRASRKAFIKNFKHAGLPLPTIHRCWFESLTPQDMPNGIAFAFLDGDFYESIRFSLEVITSRLQKGACIVIDDYQSESLPGAKKAADEWARVHSRVIKPEQSLGIIKWL